MGFSGTALAKLVAVAVHLENVDVVGQPVEQRAGEALGAERFGPFLELQVARDQRGTSVAALREKYEQELCAGLARGTKAGSSMRRRDRGPGGAA